MGSLQLVPPWETQPEYTITTPDPATAFLASLLNDRTILLSELNAPAIHARLSRLSPSDLQSFYNATNSSSLQELVDFLIRLIMKRTPQEFLEQYPDYQLSKMMFLCVPPVLILLGTFGNLFSFIVLRRKPMVKVSSYMYLAVLAVVDTVVLYNGLLRVWINELAGFDYQEVAPWICKLTVTVGYLSSDLSVWLIIAVTVERYIVVCFPFQASSMCNVSRARKVIVFLFFLMLALNIHFLWTVDLYNDEGMHLCRGGENYTMLVQTVWPWVDIMIYSFLPFLTITVLNVLIIREVAGARSNRVRLAGSEQEGSNPGNMANSRSGQTRNNASEGARLTALLLTVSFTFLLLTLPNNIVLIFTNKLWPQKKGQNLDTLKPHEAHSVMEDAARLKLTLTITELLMYTNHSINFFLYCATGNKFRQQILDLFWCLRGRCRSPAYTDNMGFSQSMRKTSHSVLLGGPNDINLAKRAQDQKSSSVSSELLDDPENGEILLRNSHPKYCLSEDTNPEEILEIILSEPESNVDNINFENYTELTYQSGDTNWKSDNKYVSSKEVTKTGTNSVLKKGPSLKEARVIAAEKGCNIRADSVDGQSKGVLISGLGRISCSKKKNKSSASKRGSFGSGCDGGTQDKEYILLQPTIRWCESTPQS